MKASIRKRIEAAMQQPRPEEDTPEPRTIIHCQDCFFWRLEGYRGPLTPPTGNCHYNPPNERGEYSKTQGSDWCSKSEGK